MKKTSDYLYDIGLGLDPKSDSLIIEAMEQHHKDKISELITDLKIKDVAYLTFMRDNLLDDSKRDDIKYVSAQKDVVCELINKLELSISETENKVCEDCGGDIVEGKKCIGCEIGNDR